MLQDSEFIDADTMKFQDEFVLNSEAVRHEPPIPFVVATARNPR